MIIGISIRLAKNRYSGVTYRYDSGVYTLNLVYIL